MCINSAVLTSASSEFCSSWGEGGAGVGRTGGFEYFFVTS